MHFSCFCGYVFHDSTDMESFKGYILADQDESDLFNALEELIVSKKAAEKKLQDMTELSVRCLSRAVYQCPECGSIFVEDDTGRLYGFRPEGEVSTNLLISAEGEKWRGMLYGDWYDEPPQWQKSRGEIYAVLNIPHETEYFDDLGEFRRRYDELFSELDGKGLLRSAILNINGKRTFLL